MEQHVKYCIDYDEHWKNVKFIYQRHFGSVMGGGGSPLFEAVTAARGMDEVAEVIAIDCSIKIAVVLSIVVV